MEVLVTHRIPESGIRLLREKNLSVTVLPENSLTKKELIAKLREKQYQGLLCLLTDIIDEEVLDAAVQMKVIANYAVGFNNIDVAAAKKRGIAVTNTPGILTNTVAEHTVALILAATTRLPEADAFVRAGSFVGWKPTLFLGRDITEKKLGIIGAGRIGSRVAEMLFRGFAMQILYNDVRQNAVLEDTCNATFLAAPEDVLRDADIVSIHLPLLESTKHFINSARLSLMKPTAVLVNASRGPIVDEDALVQALTNGTIFAAALDVFEHEPRISKKLRSLPNVILTPHTASASVETRSRMAVVAAENIIAVLHGGTAKNPVTE